ncbi:hypothetical protein RIF29_00336 [Crotalaria pallida]|uniref:RNase H type-1 domain-containing protein n=1 Tax=Crotalaria pallida TaxID=3830 RepID=A0AAN9IW13_CROPI
MMSRWHYSQLQHSQVSEQYQQHDIFEHNAWVSIDAAHKMGIGLGMGLIATTNEGTFLAAATGLQPETMDPSIAEGIVLRWCLDILIAVGLTHVTIFTDCIQVVQAWERKGKYNIYLDAIVKDGIELADQFINIRVVHKARSDNRIADFLANLAFDIYDNVWLDNVPNILYNFFPPADLYAADE